MVGWTPTRRIRLEQSKTTSLRYTRFNIGTELASNQTNKCMFETFISLQIIRLACIILFQVLYLVSYR